MYGLYDGNILFLQSDNSVFGHTVVCSEFCVCVGVYISDTCITLDVTATLAEVGVGVYA